MMTPINTGNARLDALRNDLREWLDHTCWEMGEPEIGDVDQIIVIVIKHLGKESWLWLSASSLKFT